MLRLLVLAAAVVCAAGAAFLLSGTSRAAGRRLDRCLGGPGSDPRVATPPRDACAPAAGPGRVVTGAGPGRWDAGDDPAGARIGAGPDRACALALAVGVLGVVFIGGFPGVVTGVLVAAGAGRVVVRLRESEASGRADAARMAADLPVAVDLLAACLRGGATWRQSVQAVADAVGGPLGAELAGVAARIRLGADPAEAWLRLTGSPVLAPLARTAARACHSGAAVAPTLARLADDRRHAARAEASARARSAGVWAVAPLGLCFLPAFVLLGIVPAVAGLAEAVLPTG